MLKHTFDWDELYRNSPVPYNPNLYNYWTSLSKTIGNKPVDKWDLILQSLSQGNYNGNIISLNKIFKSKKFVLPLGNYFSVKNDLPELPELLSLIKKSTYSHTVYCYACIRLVMNFLGRRIDSWIDSKISDYSNGILHGIELPKWLITIVDRQIKLGLQYGLSENDPLLFVNKWTDYNKVAIRTRALKEDDQEITDFFYYFRLNSKKSFLTVVRAFKRFAGLKPNAILQKSNFTIGIRTKGRRSKKTSRFILQNNLVAIYAYEKNRKVIHDFGYCLYEPERGIYLINGTKGIYLVPYYLITQPVIRRGREKDNKFKDAISALGYANPDFYGTIRTHRQLIEHKIIPHKL